MTSSRKVRIWQTLKQTYCKHLESRSSCGWRRTRSWRSLKETRRQMQNEGLDEMNHYKLNNPIGQTIIFLNNVNHEPAMMSYYKRMSMNRANCQGCQGAKLPQAKYLRRSRNYKISYW